MTAIDSAADAADGDAANAADGDAPAHPALDTDARRLLYDLVSTPSPSGEEAAAAERLVAFFEANGREAYVDEVGNVRAPGDDAVLLTSHVDTVPGDIPVKVKETGESAADRSDEAAESAVGTTADRNGEAVEDGPVLWGRGSVDATGPLAAMAAAAVATGVSFVGVVGEETDSRGARHLVETREAPDAVVNGEPSGADGITLGYRGFLAGTYVATSESGHTSRPEPNAIQEATRWWNAVEETFATDPDAPVFESVTTKPVSFDGGLTDDGLSVEATMEVQLRVPPSFTPEDVRERAEAPLSVGSVHWREPIPPTMQSHRTDLARAFRVAVRGAGMEPRLLRKTGTSDMNIFAGAWDCPMVTYGPGNSDLDHAPDERLPLAEFDRSVEVLTAVCERLADDGGDQ